MIDIVKSNISTHKMRFYLFKKYLKKMKLFFLGILVYELCNILNALYSNIYIRIPQLIGLVLVIYATVKLVRFRIESRYLRLMFKLYILWSIIIICRFKTVSLDELRLILFQPIHFLSYLVPFVILIPLELFFSKLSIKLYIYACIILMFNFFIIGLYLFPASNIADLAIAPFIFAPGILFLSWNYHSKPIRYLSIITLLLALYIGLESGRRNIILTSMSFLLFGWIFIFYFKKTKAYIKVLYMLFSSIIVIFVYNNFDINKFKTLADRVDTDSRSEILFAFYKDFNGLDWVYGRGIDGTYYNPTNYWDFANEQSREVDFRDNIENGFLFMILKGGVISLILFLSIALPAIYLGLFKSKNLMSKAFAIFILIYIFDMFTFGQPTFSIKYIYVWLSIAMCYSTRIRSTHDSIIYNSLKY